MCVSSVWVPSIRMPYAETKDHRQHYQQGEGSMNPLDEVLSAINGFHVQYGVRPAYVLDERDKAEPHHVHIVSDRDSARVLWRARGASIDEALAKLAEEMSDSRA